MRFVAFVVTALLAVPMTVHAFPSSATSAGGTEKSRAQAQSRPAPRPAAKSPAATAKKPSSKAVAPGLGSAARQELLQKKAQGQGKATKGGPASSAQKVVPKAKKRS